METQISRPSCNRLSLSSIKIVDRDCRIGRGYPVRGKFLCTGLALYTQSYIWSRISTGSDSSKHGPVYSSVKQTGDLLACFFNRRSGFLYDDFPNGETRADSKAGGILANPTSKHPNDEHEFGPAIVCDQIHMEQVLLKGRRK